MCKADILLHCGNICVEAAKLKSKILGSKIFGEKFQFPKNLGISVHD